MAANLVKQLATQNRLRYRFDADAPGGTVSKTRAELIADCAPGPLKTLLQGIGTWNVADVTTAKLSTLVRYFGTSLPTAGMTVTFAASPDTAEFRGPASDNGMVAIIDFVFNGSPNA